VSRCLGVSVPLRTTRPLSRSRSAWRSPVTHRSVLDVAV
jgi:hypothetical protein